MWSGIDKRCFPRAHFQCHVVVRRKNHPEDFTTRTENIGVGGICVILARELSLFTEVEVELILPDQQAGPVTSDGKVVWMVKQAKRRGERGPERFDTGIEFVNLADQARKRLEQVVQDILAGKYKSPKPSPAAKL